MLYWFENNNNNIGKNLQNIYLLSSISSVNHGLKVLEPNFRRAVALYTMRKVIESNFISREDVYYVKDYLL
jgi:hypothetical protein